MTGSSTGVEMAKDLKTYNMDIKPLAKVLPEWARLKLFDAANHLGSQKERTVVIRETIDDIMRRLPRFFRWDARQLTDSEFRTERKKLNTKKEPA